MIINDFLEEVFPNLELRPPLFYNWDTSIRFELGVGWHRGYDDLNNSYILGCYKRAITLFKAIHSLTDDIFVVIDVTDIERGKMSKRKLNIFSSYVEKSLLYRLKHRTKRYVFLEDDKERTDKTHRFSLECKTNEFKYIPLLKAICNQDLGISPSIFHRVYFININKKTIFHVYDDRGCDLLAASLDTIRDIYNIYNEWILDYDKPDIEKVFNKFNQHQNLTE